MVAKRGIKPLHFEFFVLNELQGVAGVPSLAHSSCLKNNIITATVLDPLTWSTISMQHLHHTYPALAHTLQVGHNAYIVADLLLKRERMLDEHTLSLSLHTL